MHLVSAYEDCLARMRLNRARSVRGAQEDREFHARLVEDYMEDAQFLLKLMLRYEPEVVKGLPMIGSKTEEGAGVFK